MGKRQIKQLRPAAARLLLSMLSARPGDVYTDIVERSGIKDVDVLINARIQLEVLGFVLCSPDGNEVATLFELPPTHLDVGQTKVTKAHTPPLQGR